MPETTLTCETIARKLWGEPLKRERDELFWLCPRHNDHHPSLKINISKNCFFCGPCGQDGGNWWQFAAWIARVSSEDKPAVVAWLKEHGFAIERPKTKIQPTKSKNPQLELLREHIYSLGDGTPVARKLRWGSPDPSVDKKLKSFSWQRWEGNAWIDGLSTDKQNALPFYRSILPAEAGQTLECPVILTEGEHDADAGAILGLHTTTVGGTGAFRQQHVEMLRGRHVVLIPHTDVQGRAEAEKRAALLYGVAASVRVVPAGSWKDLAEAIDAGLTRALIDGLLLDAGPWHPATGAEHLRRVISKIEEYISLTREQAICVALWCAHTHAIAAFDYTPYLAITSAEKSCGKSHLLQLAGFMSARPEACGSISAPALYRAIEKWQPTLLIDEADNLLNARDDMAEALRGVLNCGYQRGLSAIRNVGQGANMEPARFATFGAKALTGIKRLPDTIMSRALKIRMQRAKKRSVKALRPTVVEHECQPIAAGLNAWINPHISQLHQARPAIPDSLAGREADICEPLLAIADLAGQEFPGCVRHALQAICAAGIDADESLEVKLLSNIREIFKAAVEPIEGISSSEIVNGLNSRDDWPWGNMPRTGKAITVYELARMLGNHEMHDGRPIRPHHGRQGSHYLGQDFDLAWTTLLPEEEI